MHLGNMSGGAGLVRGAGDSQSVVGLQEFLLVAVGQGPPFLTGHVARLGAEVRVKGGLGLGEDLVVDVRHVADNRDAQPPVLQPAGELVESDGGTDVAHVRHPLDSRTAVVEADLALDEGDEIPDVGGGGVIEAQGHRSRLADGRSGLRVHQGGGYGGDALAAPGESQAVTGGCRDAYMGACRLAQDPLRLFPPGAEFGPVGYELHGDVADLESGSPDDPCGLGEERGTGRTGEFRAVRPEVGTKVADAGSRKQGVRCCVGHGVAVRMPGEAAFAGPEQATEPQRARRILGGIRVDVDTHTGAGQDGVRAHPSTHRAPSGPSRRPSAKMRSRGVVIFRDCVDPRTACTAVPSISTSMASSVTAAACCWSKAWAASCARSSVPRVKPCGVCTARSSSRRAVPVTSSGATAASPPVVAATILTVSTTGTTGITAAAPATRESQTRWKTDSGVRARAASWTRTASMPSISAAIPARTDSALVDPPSTTVRRGPPSASSSRKSSHSRRRPSSPGGKATHTWLATPEATMPRRACIRIGSPPSGTAALGMP